MAGDDNLDGLEGAAPVERQITPLSAQAAAFLEQAESLPTNPLTAHVTDFALMDGDVQLAAAGTPMQPPGDGAPPVRGARGGPPGRTGDQPAPPPTGDTPTQPGRPGDGPTPPPPTDAVDRNSPAFKQALEAQKEAANKIADKILRGPNPQLTGMGRAAIEAVMRPAIDEGPVAMAALEQLVNQRIQAAARTNPALRDVEFKAQHSVQTIQLDRAGTTQTNQNGEFSLIRKPPAGGPPGAKPEVIDSMRLTGTKPPQFSNPPQPIRRGEKK
ncbi:MAG: hypothetical protein K2W95_11245 [Candidatus Obscuribacterales bacterium]|nr:hypothetical protein [Candidatus Obscuribacterales bacterium]